MHKTKSAATFATPSQHRSRRICAALLAGLATLVILAMTPHISRAQSDLPSFFDGTTSLGDGTYYLTFPNGNLFGYYSDLGNGYIYHYDLGYEYVFDANDGKSGVYFYDFATDSFLYTSPTFSFPYLYSFYLESVVYYYPDTTNPGHYTVNPRYFFDFNPNIIVRFPGVLAL